jgi:NAD(P)-dependent dehydrogenase (short-subunit alcohol dehydrogenase family)
VGTRAPEVAKPAANRADRFSVEGQYALIIGGTSGIGLELARALLEGGARVIVAGSSQPKLDAALATLRPLASPGQAYGYRADVRDLDALRGLVGITLAHHGHLDLLINCQGITRLKPAEDFTATDWSDIVDTNLKSVFFACTEVGRHMLGRGTGAIINIASLSSFRGWPKSALYSITKTAIISMTQTLATEWAARGVRVNAIAPGFFMTELARSAMDPVRRERALDRTPMKRWGELDELVGAAIYLASPASRFVTGETIAVDGGFLASGL